PYRADLLRRRGERLVPGHDTESRFPGAPDHRLPQPAQLPELPGREALEPGEIGEPAGIERGRSVEPHQLQPHHAEMDPVHRPVPQTRRAEGAAVADPALQDPPGEGKLVAVLPRRA